MGRKMNSCNSRHFFSHHEALFVVLAWYSVPGLHLGSHEALDPKSYTLNSKS